MHADSMRKGCSEQKCKGRVNCLQRENMAPHGNPLRINNCIPVEIQIIQILQNGIK